MQQRIGTNLTESAGPVEEKKHDFEDDVFSLSPCRDTFSILPFKFSRNGFWKLWLDSKNSLQIVRSEMVSAVILHEQNGYQIKRLLILLINEKFYKVTLTRTMLNILNYPFEYIVWNENENILLAHKFLPEEILDPSLSVIQDLVNSAIRKIDSSFTFRIDNTEVAIEEIENIPFLNPSEEAKTFVNNQNEDFQTTFLSFSDGFRDVVLNVFSVFIDLLGIEKFQTCFNEILNLSGILHRSDDTFSLAKKYNILINTLHYIAKYLTTYPTDRICYSPITDDPITRVPFIISAEGNIFILGKSFTGSSITFSYDKKFICPALHLNSGTIKVLSGYMTKADTLPSKLSTIYPILIKQPSFFIPPPLRNYSISGHIILSMYRFEPNLYEIVIQKMFPCDANDARFKPMRILSIITQVAKGLSYLHREGLIHGDAHPGNFLLDESDQVYINDFELTVKIGDKLLNFHPGFFEDININIRGVDSPPYNIDSVFLYEGVDYHHNSNDTAEAPTKADHTIKAHPKMDSFCLGVSIYQLLIGKNYFDDKPLITLTYERTFQNKTDCKQETLFGDAITQDEIDKQIDKAIAAIPNLYKNNQERKIAEDLLRICKTLIVKDQSKRLSCEEIIPRLLAIQLSDQIKKDESTCVLSQMALRFFPAPELKERDLANNNLEQSQHVYAKEESATGLKKTENMAEEGIRILHEATRSIKLSNLKIE